MNKKMILLVGLIIVIILIAVVAVKTSDNSDDQNLLVENTTVELAGEVTSVDLSPLAYDGNAVIGMDSSKGMINVEVPARINLCPAANNIESLNDIAVGDELAVSGEVLADSRLVVCAEASHYLRVTNSNGVSGQTPTPGSTDANVNYPVTDVLMVGETKSLGAVTISEVALLEDSRCPANVNCIQAGRILISASIATDEMTKTVEFELNDSQRVDGYDVQLSDVRPGRNSETDIDNSDYQFTFVVSN